MHVSVNQEPTIGECSIKLYAEPTLGAAERVVGTATCAAEDLEPLVVWVPLAKNSIEYCRKTVVIL